LAYTFAEAFLSKSGTVKRDAIRKGFVYGMLHLGAFYLGNKDEEHPISLQNNYVPSFVIGLGVFLYYGLLYPPLDSK
jgi:hypothetical protein